MGLIFHFIKRAFPEPLSPYLLPCRQSRLRYDTMQQARAIAALRRSRRFGGYVLGVDAANSELNAGPEVFAPAIRWLRERPARPSTSAYLGLLRHTPVTDPARIGLTFHVGEDFRHLVSGLRAVDEAMRFLRMGPGDRIGHGLALGIDYVSWGRRMDEEVAMPRGERLDDLVWMRARLDQAPASFTALRAGLEDQIRDLTLDVYGPGCDGLDWNTLHLAWEYRGEDPLLVFSLDESMRRLARVLHGLPYADACWEPLDLAYSAGGTAARRNGVNACGSLRDLQGRKQRACALFRIYHLDPRVRERYKELLTVSLENRKSDWQRAIGWIQEQMLRELVYKRIAIEVNPTSNLCIGPFDELIEHPLFHWYPPEQAEVPSAPALMVGSDDPGVFATELAFEYAALAAAAQARGATPRQIERWLTDLRDTSKAFCFLDTYSEEGYGL